MIQIYSENNTNYDTNGDVVLDPEVCDLHVVLNGTWEIELIAPIDEDGKFEYIAHNAKICVDTPVGNKQLFRIYDTEKTDTDITAYARPIFMDSARDVFFVDTRPTGLNGQACLDYLMAGTPYSGESNIQLARTAYYVRKNLIEALAGSDDNSFLNRWGGEIVYDNYKIIMNVRTGEDNDVRVEYGTNIESIKQTIDVDSMATRIVPVAFNGRTLDGDSPWVDSPRINDYPIVYTQVVEFSNMKLEEDRGDLSDDDDDAEYFDTLEELQAAMIQACEQLYVDGYDLPNVTLDINMVDLRRADDYKNYQDLETVNLGDTVHCYHKILGIETEARIIEFTYDCITKTIKNIVIGDYQESYLDHISEVTSSSGTTVDFSSINNRLDYIEANYIKTVELDAEIGKFGYLTADEADITYARITELDAALIQVNELIAGEINAVHIDVDALDAEIANIISLLSGNIGTGTLDTIHLTADNAVIDSAVIMAAIMEDAIIGNLLAGVIYTDYITIMDNENGNMVLTGPTIQFTDSDGNYRMQLGLDGDGNFNIYIFNDLGDVIFDALGLTEAGLIGNGAIIRDVAVADDANISGYKLNIQEVATILNEEGSLIVDAAQVIINGETLYAAFTEIQQTADSALTEAEKALEAAGGLIEIGARNYLLNTRALTQESEKTIYTNMELSQDESDFGVLTETGAGSVLMLTAISAEKNSLGNKKMVFSCDLREENLTEILDDYDLEFGIWTSEDGGETWTEYQKTGSSLADDSFFDINRDDLSDDQWSRLIAKFTAPETEEFHVHKYGDPVFNWADDLSTCTATFECVDGDDTQTVDCTVTCEETDVTCTQDGNKTCIASVTFYGTTYTDTKTETTPALGHEYGDPVFNWASDLSTCTATFECIRGDDTITLDCAVVIDGDIYTATVTFNGQTYTDAQTPVAFAVYSSSDCSLRFYGKGVVPEPGDTYDGKSVTYVFTDFENVVFSSRSDAPWYANSVYSNARTVTFDESFKLIKPISTAYWFANFSGSSGSSSAARYITGLENINAENITTTAYMFNNCTIIEEADMSSWNTSKLETVDGMFNGCTSLETLNMANWDISNIESTAYMFEDCSGLQSVDLSNWKTPKINSMYGMFENCTALENVNMSGWDMSNVTTTQYMFYSCSHLVEIDISDWDTRNVTLMGYMFYRCYALTTIYSDDNVFTTKSVTSGNNMFTSCSKLVGGNGTAFSSSQITYAMAHVDTADNPGYFTDVADKG